MGFIHEKLDIKLLILFVLRLLPEQVSFETLSDLVLIDDGFSYFEYTQCLTELVGTGHVEKKENFYKITEKGAEQEATVESGIPYSVRLKAEQKAQPLVEKMKRDMLIGTSHETLKTGGCQVRLSLSDGIGDIITMSILAGDEEQAKQMEKYFRSDAENIYHNIIGLLTSEKIRKEE